MFGCVDPSSQLHQRLQAKAYERAGPTCCTVKPSDSRSLPSRQIYYTTTITGNGIPGHDGGKHPRGDFNPQCGNKRFHTACWGSAQKVGHLRRRSVSGIFYRAFVHHFTILSTQQQPFCKTGAGIGERSRTAESYLMGLLQAARRADSPVSLPAGEPYEPDTTAAALSKRKARHLSIQPWRVKLTDFAVADGFEARLAIVNQLPALRQWTTALGVQEKVSEERTEIQKRSEMEKGREGQERHHIERISRLFRTKKSLSGRDVIPLGKIIQTPVSLTERLDTYKHVLAIVFLLQGPSAFPRFRSNSPRRLGTVDTL